MPPYRLIPLSRKTQRYLPAIARHHKNGREMLIYIFVLAADPEADLDQDPIVSEDS